MNAGQPNLKTGSEVVGKWHKRTYRIEGELGEGANGRVYLVSTRHLSSDRRKLYALKVSIDSVDHQSEVNAIQDLEKQGVFTSNYLIDVDDTIVGNRLVPFYVMRYIEGTDLHGYLRHKGRDWIWIAGKHLLQSLANFHRHGWIFCDLKIENVIVHGHGQIELIDFGGITRKGRAVKQFTEMYDRGYWGLGTRQADEGYDLFAFAILCLQLADPKNGWKDPSQILPNQRNKHLLQERIKAHPLTNAMHPFLMKALENKFENTEEALAEWKRLMNESSQIKSEQVVNASQVGITWLSGLFIASLALFGLTIAALF